VKKFRRIDTLENVGRFGRSGNVGRSGGLVDGGDGWFLSPVINLCLQLHVDCVSYSGDYRTERLVHSISVVLHVVQILLLWS
jgi:hypothetical protein